MIQYFNPYSHAAEFLAKGEPHVEYSCKTLDSHKRMPRTMHMHRNILELVFIYSGSGLHQIGKTRYTTGEGDLLVYNAGVVHDETSPPDASLAVYCIGVSNLYLPGRSPNHLLYDDSLPVLHAREDNDTLLFLFETIHRRMVQQERFGGELIASFLRSLLLLALKLEESANQTQRLTSDHITVDRIKSYIDTHYAEPITLSSIAAHLDVGPDYISHLFKRVDGSTPMQYVIRRRIGEAQSLLINSDASITHIAFQVGYKNSNHFHTAFQKMVGLTPKDYRKYWTPGRP